MNKSGVLSTVVVAATAAFVLATPTAASARAEPVAQHLGHHVADCAQTPGIDGSHNPGRHRGFSTWNGLPC